MQAIDGAAYGVGGLSGSYLVDALVSLSACVMLAVVFGFARQLELADRQTPVVVEGQGAFSCQ